MYIDTHDYAPGWKRLQLHGSPVRLEGLAVCQHQQRGEYALADSGVMRAPTEAQLNAIQMLVSLGASIVDT